MMKMIRTRKNVLEKRYIFIEAIFFLFKKNIFVQFSNLNQQELPVEEYLQPYKPKDNYFSLAFGPELQQIDLIKADARVQSVHYPLLVRFRNLVLEKTLAVKNGQSPSTEVLIELGTLVNYSIKQELEDYNMAFGVDLIYINV